MDKFLTEEGLNLISVLLVIAAGGICFIYWVAYKMEQAREFLRQDERDTDPQPFTLDPKHIRRVLDDLGLRKTLPVYLKADAGASHPDNQDIVDLKRGTSDNLRGLL